MIIEPDEEECQRSQTGWSRESSEWDENPIPENRTFVYRQHLVSSPIIIPDTLEVKTMLSAMESKTPKQGYSGKKEFL